MLEFSNLFAADGGDLPHRSYKFGIMHIESKARSGEFAGHSLQARSSLRVEGKLVALSGRGRGWRLQLKLVHRIASLITQRGLRPARQVPRHRVLAHAG